MIEVHRVIEGQSRLYAEQATSTLERALYLESLLEAAKPAYPDSEYPPLIAAPFRYPLPVAEMYAARFRPPFFKKNVFYAARAFRTILYEHAYHYLLERVHLDAVRESGQRTAFSLFITGTQITDIHKDPQIKKIMDRRDYRPSHDYVRAHPEVEVILYPSCRDPQQGDNFAVFDIHALGTEIASQKLISFYFDPVGQSIVWMDDRLRISWNQVQ